MANVRVIKRSIYEVLQPTWDVYCGEEKLGWIENDHHAFEAHIPGAWGSYSVHRTLDKAVNFLISKRESENA
jgi:hypothetical protein